MADAAIARREARRRKILANSHNRLQLISGKNSDEVSQGEPIGDSIPEKVCENRVYIESNNVNSCSLSNGIINSESIPFELSPPDYENQYVENESPNDLAALDTPTTEITQTTSLLQKIVSNRYDIVLLSLLLQILNSVSMIDFDTNYLFMPFALHVATKLFWMPRQNNFNFANALLLLNGISSSRVQRIMAITQYVATISQDVCVFLFSTVCIQAISVLIKNTVN